MHTRGDLLTFACHECLKIFLPGSRVRDHFAHPLEVEIGNHAIFGIPCHIQELLGHTKGSINQFTPTLPRSSEQLSRSKQADL